VKGRASDQPTSKIISNRKANKTHMKEPAGIILAITRWSDRLLTGLHALLACCCGSMWQLTLLSNLSLGFAMGFQIKFYPCYQIPLTDSNWTPNSHLTVYCTNLVTLLSVALECSRLVLDDFVLKFEFMGYPSQLRALVTGVVIFIYPRCSFLTIFYQTDELAWSAIQQSTYVATPV